MNPHQNYVVIMQYMQEMNKDKPLAPTKKRPRFSLFRFFSNITQLFRAQKQARKKSMNQTPRPQKQEDSRLERSLCYIFNLM